jgi:hypothetical protein
MSATDANKISNSFSFVLVVTALTRLVTFLYAILAIFAFFDCRGLLSNESFEMRGDTLYVPLVLCVPGNIEIDGSVLSFDASDTSELQCRQLDYLINSCAASLLFSAAASGLFILFDGLARYNMGPFNLSSAAGMGLFLIFILLQAGISTGSLVEQNKYWVDYFQHFLDETSDEDLNVKSFSNSGLLIITAISAFATAFLILADSICYRSCYEVKTRSDNNLEQFQAEEGMKRQSKQIEEATQSTKPFEDLGSPTDAPAWASKV